MSSWPLFQINILNFSMNAPPAELLGADQDLMGLLAVDVNDESDPAGVLLQGGVVQTCDEEFATNKIIYLK